MDSPIRAVPRDDAGAPRYRIVDEHLEPEPEIELSKLVAED